MSQFGKNSKSSNTQVWSRAMRTEDVGVQVTLAIAPVLAVGTLERLLPSVPQHMLLHVVPGFEPHDAALIRAGEAPL